jgi:hypothetical protein
VMDEDAKRRTLQELHAFDRSKAEAVHSFEQKLVRFAATLTPGEKESFTPLLTELGGSAQYQLVRPIGRANTRRQTQMAKRDVDVRINNVPEEGGSEYLVSIAEDGVSIRRLGTSADASTAYLKPMQKAEDAAYLKPMQKVEGGAYLKPMQKVEEDPSSFRQIEELRNRMLSEIPVRPTSSDNFKAALTKLASDNTYRNAAIKDPGLILNDFKLSLKELSALRSVAAMSGADIRAVDSLAARAIAARADSDSTDVDVSCCSCCCCCCGETAAVATGW